MTRRMSWILWLLVTVVVLDAVALGVALVVRRPSVETVSGQEERTGTAAIGGPFTLTSTDGRTVTDQTYRGKWMLIYFGYTFCPDACPTALNNMSIALQKLGKEAEQIQPLFVTVDPKRDTREVMSAYLESFDPRIVGLRGNQEQTDVVAKTYRLYVEVHKDEGDNYLIDHSAYVYLMDPAGKFADVIEGATPGDQMADKLRRLIKQSST